MKNKKFDYHNMNLKYKKEPIVVEEEQWWIGVDLDGTLAKYDGWVGPSHIGDPVWEMLERVIAWIDLGYRVKIFTARCRIKEQEAPIADWLEEHGIGGLEITNVKDHKMVELWDDRCVQVVKNTGQPVSGSFSQIEDEVKKDEN